LMLGERAAQGRDHKQAGGITAEFLSSHGFDR